MKADHLIALFLLDIALLIAIGRLLAVALARVHQPPVMAEILAGIVIGPSLLGAVAPEVSSTLITPEVLQLLSGIGTIGLVLFVFLIGLDLDTKALNKEWRGVSSISLGALLVPFTAGVLVAIPLYRSHSLVGDDTIPFIPFVIFIGTALSITAFPVLARILEDRGLANTELGALALSCAAIQDLAGWMLLTALLIVLAGNSPVGLGLTVGEFLAFGATLIVVVRPALRLGFDKMAEVGRTDVEPLSVVAAILLVSAGLTQLIGLHSVLGALLFGLAFPTRDLNELAGKIRRAVWPLTVAVFLPIYFVGPGMSIDLGNVGPNGTLEIAVLTIIACASKFSGVAGGAKWAGFDWREGLAIGVLMNTRGLMELIVLNVGYSVGLLDSQLYGVLIVVALITTFMTGPTLTGYAHTAVARFGKVAPEQLTGVGRTRRAGLEVLPSPR